MPHSISTIPAPLHTLPTPGPAASFTFTLCSFSLMSLASLINSASCRRSILIRSSTTAELSAVDGEEEVTCSVICKSLRSRR